MSYGCIGQCGSSSLTSRGQTAADGAIETGLTDAWVGVQHTAQLHLTQPCDLGVETPLVLERQLITVQHQGAQAALEPVLGSGRGPCSTL